MSYEKIKIEIRDSIGILTLSDPERLNALSFAMLDEFNRALDELLPSIRVLIVTGAGRAFCSGASLDGGIGEMSADPAQRDLGSILETHLNPLMSRLRNLPMPWICAVNGVAAGAGASLALAADLIVASDKAYFLLAFARIGLVPDAGVTHILVHTIGRVRAMQMMLLAEPLPAAAAVEWGLINRVVAEETLQDETVALAEKLAHGPLVALGLMRQTAWDALDLDWESALRKERDTQLLAGRTRDFMEGVAAFNEKRKARFTGS